MNILLTNDDGYSAPGIVALQEKLSPHHSVYLCAPLNQMSATSHAIHLNKPMELKRLSGRNFAIEGTPADCIKVAICHLYKDIRFDMVLSGINNGPNLGEDIFYSGTVAGAREGLMNGIFSIAVSLNNWNDKPDFHYSSSMVAELIHHIPDRMFKEKIFLNINFPNIPKPKGIKAAHLGERIYRDFIIQEKIEGKETVMITGEDPGFHSKNGSDMDAISEGYISITPLAIEVPEYKLWHEVQSLEKIHFQVD